MATKCKKGCDRVAVIVGKNAEVVVIAGLDKRTTDRLVREQTARLGASEERTGAGTSCVSSKRP